MQLFFGDQGHGLAPSSSLVNRQKDTEEKVLALLEQWVRERQAHWWIALWYPLDRRNIRAISLVMHNLRVLKQLCSTSWLTLHCLLQSHYRWLHTKLLAYLVEPWTSKRIHWMWLLAIPALQLPLFLPRLPESQMTTIQHISLQWLEQKGGNTSPNPWRNRLSGRKGIREYVICTMRLKW